MTLRTSALFSDPGRADVSGHFGTSVLPPLKPQRRPRQFKPFEAQSHGFCARLLRFVQGSPQCYARMAPGCRPALPGGLGFPLGHDRRFRSAIASHLPSPGFSWRQVCSFYMALSDHGCRFGQAISRVCTINMCAHMGPRIVEWRQRTATKASYPLCSPMAIRRRRV